MENDLTVGFIGGGALTETMLKGLAGNLLPPENIFVSDHKEARCAELREKYSVTASAGAESFCHKADVIIFAVKPKDAEKAMRENEKNIHENVLIVSVIAGLTLSDIENHFPDNACIRVMPNVAQAVGEGMAAYAVGENAGEKDAALVQKIFSAVGKIVSVTENLMDAVTGLSGSGPAFMFLALDAMAEGGVMVGLPRKTAEILAAQTMLGAAKMALAGEHPEALRDKVTSPAGTTIAGVRALERANFRSALIEAVVAAAERSKELH